MVITIRKSLSFLGLLGIIYTSLSFNTQKSYAVNCSCRMNEFCNRLYKFANLNDCKTVCELIGYRNNIKHLMVFTENENYGPDTVGCQGKPCINPIYPHGTVKCPPGK